MSYRAHQPKTHRTRPRILLGILVCTILASSIGQLAFAAGEAAPTTSQLYINEIKSGDGSPVPQYVTIYNISDQDVSLAGWRLEYAKASFPIQHCNQPNWKLAVSNASSVNVATASAMNITVAAHSASAPIKLDINDDDPGSVHLADTAQTVHDTVGWGTAEAAAPCYETAQAANIEGGRSLMRYTACDAPLPIDSNDNSADFKLYSASGSTPTAEQAPKCTPAPEPSVDSSCRGVTVSEILPNPAGSDGGHEFIELRNPTNEVISLQACSIQVGDTTSKLYALGNVSLQPGQYLSLSDTTTSLNLVNSSPTTVWLLEHVGQSDQLEISSATYPADMEDGTAWALADGTWSATYTPTPGNPNIATTLKPCEDGLIRNPETNRCITSEANTSMETASASTATTSTAVRLTPCKASQERNPDTNRCRNITNATTSTQTACKEGQERNPATNRCRNIATTASTKPCPEGQERNPDTNRCRKVLAAGSGNNISKVQDIASEGSTAKKPYWLIALAALGLAIAYGIYEWRHEIIGGVKKLAQNRPTAAVAKP